MADDLPGELTENSLNDTSLEVPESSNTGFHFQTSHSDPKKKRLFSKELRCMMYGFGDDENPYTETVDMLEDVVIQFISDITFKAMDIGRTGKVTVEDIMYLKRRDYRKFGRIRELLSMNEELKKARKAFDEVDKV